MIHGSSKRTGNKPADVPFKMEWGAVICGMETEHLMIQEKTRDSVWKIEGDRIVAGTYCSAAMAGGSIS